MVVRRRLRSSRMRANRSRMSGAMERRFCRSRWRCVRAADRSSPPSFRSGLAARPDPTRAAGVVCRPALIRVSFYFVGPPAAVAAGVAPLGAWPLPCRGFVPPRQRRIFCRCRVSSLRQERWFCRCRWSCCRVEEALATEGLRSRPALGAAWAWSQRFGVNTGRLLRVDWRSQAPPYHGAGAHGRLPLASPPTQRIASRESPPTITHAKTQRDSIAFPSPMHSPPFANWRNSIISLGPYSKHPTGRT